MAVACSIVQSFRAGVLMSSMGASVQQREPYFSCEFDQKMCDNSNLKRTMFLISLSEYLRKVVHF